VWENEELTQYIQLEQQHRGESNRKLEPTKTQKELLLLHPSTTPTIMSLLPQIGRRISLLPSSIQASLTTTTTSTTRQLLLHKSLKPSSPRAAITLPNSSPSLKRYQSSASSTSALAYKALHHRVSPLPTTDTQPWSASTAVSSILYETPLPSAAPPKRHILNCLVQNEPGVLSRVSGILAARGFNIDSLVVCNTEVEDLSRMTIVLGGQDGVVEQARRQLEDLVPVWAVLDYTSAPLGVFFPNPLLFPSMVPIFQVSSLDQRYFAASCSA